MTDPEPEADGKGDQPHRRVAMSVGARTVEIEGPDELDALIFAATAMWHIAGAATEPRLWAGGMGFCAELATDPPTCPPDEEDTIRPVAR